MAFYAISQGSPYDVAPVTRSAVLSTIAAAQISVIGSGGGTSFYYSTAPAFSAGTGTTYHVATTGNDTTGTGASGSPWATPTHALAQCSPGDNVYVHAGTYTSATNNNAEQAAVVEFTLDGTAGNPITLMANPGDEGSVIIDGSNVNVGIHTLGKDYIQIYGLTIQNTYRWGIATYAALGDASMTWASVQATASQYIRIENNKIYQVTNVVGANSCAIRWSTMYRSILRNNKIIPVDTNVHCLQSYGSTDCLVENNYFQGRQGTYFKDHIMDTTTPWVTLIGNEVRYNVFDCFEYSMQIGLRGTGAGTHGYTYFHHNICYGSDGSAGPSMGIFSNDWGGGGQGGQLKVEHNIFDGESSASYWAFNYANDSEADFNGNIMVQSANALVGVWYDSSRNTLLKSCDYNIYNTSSTFAQMDKYGASSISYAALTNWQLALASGSNSLDFDYPDTNSTTSTPSVLFTNISTRDYTHAAGSPALTFMSDGSNAGCYQTGSETIGLTSGYNAG